MEYVVTLFVTLVAGSAIANTARHLWKSKRAGICCNRRHLRDTGPGTGKTFGLARRIQRIVHSDGLSVRGSNVLIVAFNRVIARDLRNDIDRCIADSPHDGEPVIRTVHALCLQVIGTPLRLLLPDERTGMLYDVLATHPTLVENYTRKDKADQALQEHEAKLVKHLALWQAVQRWLTRHTAILISDLPGLLLDKIKAGDYEGSKYEHVIVDEFQDLGSIMVIARHRISIAFN